MKILQIVHSLGIGGAEKFAVELSNELSNNNEVVLCSVKPIEGWMNPAKSIGANVKTEVLGIESKFSFGLLSSLYSLIKRNKPDVVHVHSSLLVFYLFIISACYPDIVFLQTVHNTISPGYKKLFSFLNLLRLINNKFINVCISKDIYREYTSSYVKLKFVQIDNGIKKIKQTHKFGTVKNEIEQLKRTPKTKVFLAAGNYSDFKNFAMLAEVFKELEILNKDVILIILGSSENENYNKVTQLKSANTYQLGLKDNAADYMFCADALVISSTMEGMPLVALEALCAGLPIITTPVGGMIDVVENDKNDLIAKDFSKESLLEKIKLFLDMDNNSITMIKDNNHRKYLDKYSIENCAANYLKIFSAGNA